MTTVKLEPETIWRFPDKNRKFRILRIEKDIVYYRCFEVFGENTERLKTDIQCSVENFIKLYVREE